MCPHLRPAAVLTAALLLPAGCGESYETPPAKVAGTIAMDGAPLADAKVGFYPEEGGPSFGLTDSDGHYELAVAPGLEGVRPGPARVRISTASGGGVGEAPAEKPETVPAEYNVDTTLTRTVAAGDNAFDFDLKSGGAVKQQVTIESD